MDINYCKFINLNDIGYNQELSFGKNKDIDFIFNNYDIFTAFTMVKSCLHDSMLCKYVNDNYIIYLYM